MLTCEGADGGTAALLRGEQNAYAIAAYAARSLRAAVVRRQPRPRHVGAPQHAQHHLQDTTRIFTVGFWTLSAAVGRQPRWSTVGHPSRPNTPAEWLVTRRGLIVHTPTFSCSESGKLIAVSWPFRAFALVYARESHVNIAAQHSASIAPSKAAPQGLGRRPQPQRLLFRSHLAGTSRHLFPGVCL